MSEEGMDQVERADEPKDDDVEAHSLDAPVDAPHATEEPPDVEGHSFDSMDAMDARPID